MGVPEEEGSDPVLRPEADSSLEVEFGYGNGTELPPLGPPEDNAEVAIGLLLAPVPTREDVGVAKGVSVIPGNRLEVVLFTGGYGAEESTVLVPGLLLPVSVREDGGILKGAGDPGRVLDVVPFGYGTDDTALLPGPLLPVPVREDGGILNGAGDPGKVVETVPFAEGCGTVLAVGSGKDVVPDAVIELVELSVACVVLLVEPISEVELPKMEGLGIDDGSEDHSVPDTGLPVPPADGAYVVELDKGNGAELEGPGYGPDDPRSALPVDRGPTVPVMDGVVSPPEEAPVAGGYPVEVVCTDRGVGVLVMLPKGTGVGACELPEPEIAFVDELDAGYGAELGAPEGVDVVDSNVERGLGDIPGPAAVPDEAGTDVPFVKG